MTITSFTSPPYSMICGSGDAEKRRYRRIDGKRGVWLVAVQENEGDNVYFHNPRDKHSEGFAGRTLEFSLEDGTIYQAKGPWKSNADDLFLDTGYDAREKFFSVVVIGRGREMDYSKDRYYGQTVITDVVYQDAEPKLGKFDRVQDIIDTLPPGNYAFWMQTSGMTASGFKEKVVQ